MLMTLTSVQRLYQRACVRSNVFPLIQVCAYGIEHEMRHYKLREEEADLHRSKPTDDPEKPKNFTWFPTNAPKETDFSIYNIRKWYAHTQVVIDKQNQEFIPERHHILGADLATAHFVIHRDGKVRFQGDTYWTVLEANDSHRLPHKYDPLYIIEAVDINGFNLYYDGLSNLCGLTKLKWLSLKDCKNIDDWGLDKISAEYPNLEYLDISGCVKITERGLECLYRMMKLKTLIVTNHHKSVAFELSCFMLEECIPGLTCTIHVPDKTSEQ